MMKLKLLFAGIIGIATIAATTLPATAGDWRRHHRGHHHDRTIIVERHHYRHAPRRLVRPQYRTHHYRPHVIYRDRGGDVAGAAILGLALGAIAGAVAAESNRHASQPERRTEHCTWISENTRRCR